MYSKNNEEIHFDLTYTISEVGQYFVVGIKLIREKMCQSINKIYTRHFQNSEHVHLSTV